MKKIAFTLPEILIVLLLIATIAVVCVPEIVLGVTNTRHQANYKRAYHLIHSIVAIEYLNGKLPSKTNSATLTYLYSALIGKMDVKEYAEQKENGPNDGAIYNVNDFKYTVEYLNDGKTEKKNENNAVNSAVNAIYDWTKTPSPWFVTENDIAYSIIGVSNEKCSSKEELNNIKEIKKLNEKACAVIIVDVNGLTMGPNKLDEQVIYGIGENKRIEPMIKDRYYIYIGSDGVAQGSKTTSLSARLMNNMQ